MKMTLSRKHASLKKVDVDGSFLLGAGAIVSALIAVGLITWDCFDAYSYAEEGLNINEYAPVKSLVGSVFAGLVVLLEIARRDFPWWDIFPTLFLVVACSGTAFLFSNLAILVSSPSYLDVQEELLIEQGYERVNHVEENTFYVEQNDEAYLVTIEQDKEELYFTAEETEKEPQRNKLN